MGIPCHVLRAILFLFSGVQFSKASTIYISPNGNDSAPNCGDRRSNPCHSLDFVFSHRLKTGANSTQISATRGKYTLKYSHILEGVTNFGIAGNDDVEITCETNASLSFILSDTIFLDGIKFKYCGGWRTSTVDAIKPYSGLDGVKFKAALDFRYCRNLRISNVEVSSSPGLGLNGYDVGGVVNFTNCVFVDNTAKNSMKNETKKLISRGSQTERKEYVFSGGGIYLALDPYGYNTVNVTPKQHDSYQHNNTFIFQNCSFIRNEAIWLNASNPSDFVDTPELPFSRGGGLAIYFRSNASGCTISIISCVFSGNRAHWGGGLQVEMIHKPENNHLKMKDTRFENNEGVLAGGGARMGNLVKGIQDRLNTFTADNCLFVNNTAIWGGGTSLYGSTIPGRCTNNAEVSQFFFNECQWKKNTGTVGSANGAFILNKNEDQIGPEVPYHISINSCTFEGNYVRRIKDFLSIGEGAFYSVEVPLALHGNVTFINNTRTALALDRATMEIYDQLYFMNNTGFKGGGMAMYGRSRIIFNEDSLLLFEGNQCRAQGGALYIDAPGPPLVSFNATGMNIHICFFEYTNQTLDFDDWKTKVIFQNNKAPFSFAGNSVYATTLQNCRRVGEPRQNNSVLRWKFVEFKKDDGNLSSIENEVSTDPVDMQYDSEDWVVAPSERFNAKLRLVDELGGSVHGAVNVKIVPSDLFSPPIVLATPSSTFLTNGSISSLRLSGKPGESFSVEINYLGRQILTETIPDRTLKSCNPGFTLNSKGRRCLCMDSSDGGVSSCKSDGKTFYLKRNYWGGTIKGEFFTHFCPIGYCKSDVHASEKMYNSSDICNDDRDQKSILCGDCKANTSVVFGGEVCSSKCSNWYLLLLLLYGLILLAVVLGIMLIDLDFFTSYLNAWLYSYQVMNVVTPDGFKFDPFIEFIIGLANFQLKVGSGGICFAKGLDDADKLAILYVLPTYVLVLVVLLAKSVGWFPNWCFSRRVKAAPFRALCTIVVLCYTDITRISLRILHPASFGSQYVMYAKGSIHFFGGKHIAYGILASLFILCFVIPFPLILAFRPCLIKGLRPILNLNRWKPIFDALQSCFKDEYRWCAAFYFLCRLVLLAIATFMDSSPLKRALLESSCVLILLTIAYLRPYKEAKDVKEDEESYDWINRSDVVLLATLTLIAVFSSPVESDWGDSTWLGFYIFVDFLAYIPLLVCAMVAVRSVRKYRREAKRDKENSVSELSISDGSDSATDITQRPSERV